MHLSKRTDYALRAMVELALVYKEQRFLSVKEIAERESIPKKFLEQILSTLKHVGYLESRIGPGGGYSLRKAPKDITFGAVIRVFDGDLAPTGCVSLENPKFCSEQWHCRFHRVMLDLRNAISGVLDTTTLADVCETPPRRPTTHNKPVGRR